jgi:hypothetical protein
MLRATHPLAALLLRALVLWCCGGAAGVMHVYSHNHSEACVRLSDLAGLATPEIFIPDKDMRNRCRTTLFSFLFFSSLLIFSFRWTRAVHGDSVAVELLPESEWSAPSSVVKHDYDDDEEENMEGGRQSPSRVASFLANAERDTTRHDTHRTPQCVPPKSRSECPRAGSWACSSETGGRTQQPSLI